jgi:hypothetical protein
VTKSNPTKLRSENTKKKKNLSREIFVFAKIFLLDKESSSGYFVFETLVENSEFGKDERKGGKGDGAKGTKKQCSPAPFPLFSLSRK